MGCIFKNTVLYNMYRIEQDSDRRNAIIWDLKTVASLKYTGMTSLFAHSKAFESTKEPKLLDFTGYF